MGQSKNILNITLKKMGRPNKMVIFNTIVFVLILVCGSLHNSWREWGLPIFHEAVLDSPIYVLTNEQILLGSTEDRPNEAGWLGSNLPHWHSLFDRAREFPSFLCFLILQQYEVASLLWKIKPKHQFFFLFTFTFINLWYYGDRKLFKMWHENKVTIPKSFFPCWRRHNAMRQSTCFLSEASLNSPQQSGVFASVLPLWSLLKADCNFWRSDSTF